MTSLEEMLNDHTEPSTWDPRYIDILELRTSDDEETAEYYSQFGFDKLVVPSTCTYVTSAFTRLTTRFNERYYFRYIGQETLERWQVRLQNRMDEIVEEMDRAYQLYATTANINDVVSGSKITYGHTATHSGTDTVTGTSRDVLSTTPDSSINENNSYASNVSKGNTSNTSTYGSSNALTGTDTTVVTGPEILAGVNISIDSWRDIDTFFISQFENNFLNIFE